MDLHLRTHASFSFAKQIWYLQQCEIDELPRFITRVGGRGGGGGEADQKKYASSLFFFGIHELPEQAGHPRKS